MNRKPFHALMLAVLFYAAPLGAQGAGTAGEAPRLVVVVVVDQMRADFLDRFDDLYTGGFRRLLDRGAVFTSAQHRHGVPHTAPGHATLATGTYPSHHGIVGNTWVDRAERRAVYAVEDGASPIIGLPDREGRSPRNLQRPTLGTHLKKAYASARVVAVAGKDRSAIAMAGHDADGSYWFDRDSGRFVTSGWYADTEPPWLAGLNASGEAAGLATRPWSLLRDSLVYLRSPALAQGEPLRFPKEPARGATTSGSFAPGFAATPQLDALTLAAAVAAMQAHGLGEDAVPDLLWIGLSAADFIGHTYGPWSPEAQDEILRLDHMLGQLMEHLDARFGTGYWLVLSADHGVMPNPDRLAREGHDAGRVDMQEVGRLVREALTVAAAAEGIRSTIPASLDLLNLYLIFPESVPPEAARRIRRRVADAAASHPNISAAISSDELVDPAADRPLLELYRRSAYPGRTPDVFLRPMEHWMMLPSSTTATHMTPYQYDLHVPLVFLGPPFHAARYGRPVETADLAATLARLLGFPPTGMDGRPLPELTGGP